jgi:hypothetical protein
LTPAPPTDRPRLIALGASNLTRLLPILVATARRAAGGPVEVLGALGHGRSYGARSHFLARSLPGIDACGLWDALRSAPRPAAPRTGLVMDVGNDILYGFEVERIAGWVDRALARLRPEVDRLVVAGLPGHALQRVGWLRFGLLRTVLVPSCRIGRGEALRRAAALDGALRELAGRHGARFLPMPAGWYGFDPIHVRRRHLPDLAAELCGAGSGARRADLAEVARIRAARALERRVFGRTRHRPQPAVRLADGTTVALY